MRAKPKEKQILLFIFEMRILIYLKLFIIYIYNN